MASRRVRLERRASIFGGTAETEIQGANAVGWFKAPRTLPIMLQVLRHKQVVGNLDCDRVYVELLARDMGDGFIETGDESDHAFMAGFAPGRGARSWRERMVKLVELGFVRSAPKMGRAHGYVLIIDPEAATQKVLEDSWGSADAEREALLAAFKMRRLEVGSLDDDGSNVVSASGSARGTSSAAGTLTKLRRARKERAAKTPDVPSPPPDGSPPAS